MAAGAVGEERPTLFLRKATGLVRGWSVRDSLIYACLATNFVTLGLFEFTSAGPADALRRAYASIYLTIQQQAAVLAYVRIIEDLAIVTAVFVPLILLFLRKNRPGEAPAGAH